jgi:hypothetical protein
MGLLHRGGEAIRFGKTFQWRRAGPYWAGAAEIELIDGDVTPAARRTGAATEIAFLIADICFRRLDTTVGQPERTGDVACLIGRQKGEDVRDLFGPSAAPCAGRSNAHGSRPAPRASGRRPLAGVGVRRSEAPEATPFAWDHVQGRLIHRRDNPNRIATAFSDGRALGSWNA